MSRKRRSICMVAGAGVICLLLLALTPSALESMARLPILPKGVRMGMLTLSGLVRTGSYDPSIAFYGRVVDQDGSPVYGAQVEMRLDRHTVGAALAGKGDETQRLFATTASDGTFEVRKVRGARLCVENVTKDGFTFVGFPNRIFQYFYVDVPAPYVADPAHPEVFTLWRPFHSSSRVMRLSGGGRAVAFNERLAMSFDSQGRFSTTFDDAPDAGLYLTMIMTPDNVGVSRPALQIDVPGGGAVESDEVYSYRAPEDGYKEHLVYIDMAELYRGVPSTQAFYVRMANGCYVSLQVDLQPNPAHNRTVLRFSGQINLSGNRDLQPPQHR